MTSAGGCASRLWPSRGSPPNARLRPMKSAERFPVNWMLCACTSVISDLDSISALRQSLGKQKRRK
jgi:hypothetical protein